MVYKIDGGMDFLYLLFQFSSPFVFFFFFTFFIPIFRLSSFSLDILDDAYRFFFCSSSYADVKLCQVMISFYP
jgi:hypothetical protein